MGFSGQVRQVPKDPLKRELLQVHIECHSNSVLGILSDYHQNALQSGILNYAIICFSCTFFILYPKDLLFSPLFLKWLCSSELKQNLFPEGKTFQGTSAR